MKIREPFRVTGRIGASLSVQRKFLGEGGEDLFVPVVRRTPDISREASKAVRAHALSGDPGRVRCLNQLRFACYQVGLVFFVMPLLPPLNMKDE